MFLSDSNRQTVESQLDEVGLQRLAEVGGGIYQTADYRDGDTERILELAVSGSDAQASEEEQIRVWNERFYWLLVPVMLAILPRFRRHRLMQEDAAE